MYTMRTRTQVDSVGAAAAFRAFHLCQHIRKSKIAMTLSHQLERIHGYVRADAAQLYPAIRPIHKALIGSKPGRVHPVRLGEHTTNIKGRKRTG